MGAAAALRGGAAEVGVYLAQKAAERAGGARAPAPGEEEWWHESGGRELDPVLGSGAILLLDAGWAVERAGSGGVLAPRQALPPTAFMSHGGVRAASSEVDLLRVVCVSHCWLQADHPDPRGHNLRILGRALSMLATDPEPFFQGRWAAFLDFCCIHQNCRDREGVPQRHTYQRLEDSGALEEDAIGRFEREQVLFKEALGSLGLFYSHPNTVVFMLTRFPDDYDDPARYTRSGNTEPYFHRGWCFCESSWSMLAKSSLRLVDLGRSTGVETCFFGSFGRADSVVATCAAGRRAPLLPDAFESELQSKGFTNGKDDRPRVAELYRAAFAKRLEAAQQLAYSDLEWGDEEAQQLAAVLSSGAAPLLLDLSLDNNRVGDEGAARLAELLRDPGALPRLEELNLAVNLVGDEGAARLAEAVQAPGALPRLEKLHLNSNRVGDEGVARLAEALSAPGALPRLRELNLNGNRVGDGGAARLAEALWAPGAVPQLVWLGLADNLVGDEGAARLAEGLLAPGALPQLRELCLNGNRVGDGGAARLAEALRAPGAVPQLEWLALFENPPLGSTGKAALRAAWAEARRQGGLLL